MHLTFGRFVDENQLGVFLGAPFDVLLPDGIATPVQPDLVFTGGWNPVRAR